MPVSGCVKNFHGNLPDYPGLFGSISRTKVNHINVTFKYMIAIIKFLFKRKQAPGEQAKNQFTIEL